MKTTRWQTKTRGKLNIPRTDLTPASTAGLNTGQQLAGCH
jgi:hypothetical protein